MLLENGRKNILNLVSAGTGTRMSALTCYYGYDKNANPVLSSDTYAEKSSILTHTIAPTEIVVDNDKRTITYKIEVQATEKINTIALGTNSEIYTRILFYEIGPNAKYQLTYTLYF